MTFPRRRLREGILGTLLQATANESNIENDRFLESRVCILCAILLLELALNRDESYGIRCLHCFTID